MNYLQSNGVLLEYDRFFFVNGLLPHFISCVFHQDVDLCFPPVTFLSGT